MRPASLVHDTLQTFCLDLLLAARHWRRLADAVARTHGLSEATALPLIHLARQGRLRQASLAQAIGVEAPSLVRTLDQLCALGLVSREADPSDGRAKSLVLTEHGRRLTQCLSGDLAALRRRVFADIDPDDIEAAGRVFTRLTGPSDLDVPAERSGAER